MWEDFSQTLLEMIWFWVDYLSNWYTFTLYEEQNCLTCKNLERRWRGSGGFSLSPFIVLSALTRATRSIRVPFLGAACRAMLLNRKIWYQTRDINEVRVFSDGLATVLWWFCDTWACQGRCVNLNDWGYTKTNRWGLVVILKCGSRLPTVQD